MGVYYQEHRLHPRVAVQWPARLRTRDGQHVFSFTALNVSSGGIGLRGAQPVRFDLPDGEEEPLARFELEVDLPGGRRLQGLQVEQAWETEQSGHVLTGCRFVSVTPEAARVLQEVAGVGEAVSPASVAHCADPWMEDEIELWDYVKVLVRRRWTVIGWTVLVAAAALGWTLLKPETYTATALVLPIGEVDYLSRTEGLGGVSQVSKPYVTVLESVPVRRSVARDTFAVELDGQPQALVLVEYLRRLRHLERPRELSAQEWNRQLENGAIGWLKNAVKVSQDRKDHVIKITCKAPAPGLAAQIANQYIEELSAYELRTSSLQTRQNLAMAQARMDTLRQELTQAEQRLEAFRERNQRLLQDSLKVLLAYPEVATQYQRLEREASLKQSLFSTVANQYELLRLQLSKNATGFEVVARAEPPLSSDKSVVKPVVLGGLVGGMLGIFAAFLREYIAGKETRGELDVLAEAWREDRDRLAGWVGR